MCVGNTLGLYLRKGVSKPLDESVQNCQLPLRQVPQAPRSTILLPTTCGRVAKSVSTTAWASTLLSVLPAHLASISASVGNSVMTRDSAFRKLSVWPTFPAFTSASLLTNASFSILRIVLPGFCKPVMKRLNKSIKFQITHFLGNTNRSEWLHACRVARLKVP